ncbi:MAG TPA: hypothetical protein VFA43_07210, partial [Gemmatimonadaceae bacterium]|nr:hypothetical protein [Gemmatimonadaceae bacterium]
MRPSQARAQSPTNGSGGSHPAPSSAAPTPLDRLVSVNLRDASVRDALDQLRASTGIDFNFESSVVNDIDQRVTFRDSRTTLGRALAYVLRGTGLVAVPFDSSVIVRASLPSTVRGRVVNIRTGAPIVGSTVVIVG